MRYTQETFVKKAIEVHNGRYDYSKTEYKGHNEDVVIICPKHGEFRQRAGRHIQGSGCRKCGLERRRQTNMERYGAPSWAASKAARALSEAGKGPWAQGARKKAADTCLERFGAKTWAESEVGHETAHARCQDPEVRRAMSERIKNEEVLNRRIETSRSRYGADCWAQSDVGRKRLHEIFSTEEERKARSERMLSEKTKEKIRATGMARYGTPYYWQSDEGRARLKFLLSQDEVQAKILETKKQRGTLNSSKAEKAAYAALVERFGCDDVVSQYKADVRYPFACDFYIRSMDLFIELNASWLHGFHWFDDKNPDDLIRLNMLYKKKLQKVNLCMNAPSIFGHMMIFVSERLL